MARGYAEEGRGGSGIARVLAPNPSPMTESGTNSYVLRADGAAVVIDPGPVDEGHLAALRAAIGGDRLLAVIVTHPHLDHSPLARRLAGSAAPVVGFGRFDAGRSALMRGLADLGGGEGVDHAFAPDVAVGDGVAATLGGDPVEAVHAPGHMAPHLALRWRGTAFTGDAVMGWASTMISPPDGDLGQFMATLDRLEAWGAIRALPGHGAPVPDLAARCRDLRDHRMSREAAILAALPRAPRIPDLVAAIYSDVPPALHPAAARNVLAHLLHLWERGRVLADPAPGPEAQWTIP